jgi:hypothetical protein
MAAPTPTVRPAPFGYKLDDGWQSFITLSADTDICFWEKTIKPPALDGGDPVDTTTMHNDVWRGRSPRSLITMDPVTINAAYDPKLYTAILSILNVETTITVTFPNGDTLCFYGFLNKFEPGELSEAEAPTCAITIIPTNEDPTTGAEEAPVFTHTAGTGT